MQPSIRRHATACFLGHHSGLGDEINSFDFGGRVRQGFSEENSSPQRNGCWRVVSDSYCPKYLFTCLGLRTGTNDSEGRATLVQSSTLPPPFHRRDEACGPAITLFFSVRLRPISSKKLSDDNPRALSRSERPGHLSHVRPTATTSATLAARTLIRSFTGGRNNAGSIGVDGPSRICHSYWVLMPSLNPSHTSSRRSLRRISSLVPATSQRMLAFSTLRSNFFIGFPCPCSTPCRSTTLSLSCERPSLTRFVTGVAKERRPS